MSNDISTTAQEKTDLSLHVDLCAQRYLLLEKRLEILETKFDKLADDIRNNSNSLKTTIIGSAGTILAGMLGLIVTLIIK